MIFISMIRKEKKIEMPVTEGEHERLRKHTSMYSRNFLANVRDFSAYAHRQPNSGNYATFFCHFIFADTNKGVNFNIGSIASNRKGKIVAGFKIFHEFFMKL